MNIATIPIFTKNVLSEQYKDIIEFDEKYMILGAAIPMHDTPPILTIEELHVAETRGDEIYWICDSENKRLGYYWTERRPSSLFLSAIVISTPFRGKKIGSQVLYWIEKSARNYGLNHCSLAVSNLNAPALNLYFKNDYQKVKDDPNYFGSKKPNVSRLILEKNLI
jgi:ribosomal protein S18 acetylase RimI-like enzyme